MQPLILRFDVEDGGGQKLHSITVNLQQMGNQLDQNRAKMGLFDRAFASFRSALDSVRGAIFSVGSALAALGITLSAGALIRQVREAANELDELAKASQRTGVSVEDLSKLKIAAGLSDVDFGSLQDSIRFLQVNAVASDAAFGQLGVTIRDVSGNIRPTKDLLFDVADALSRVEDPAQKAALAIAIFGRSGTSLLPLISSNLKEAVEQAEQLGAVFTTEMADSAEAFNDSMTRLEVSITAVRNVLAAEFFPTATNVFDNLAVYVGKNRKEFIDWAKEALPNLAQITDGVVDVAEAIAVMFAVAKDGFNGVLVIFAAFRVGLAAVEAGIKGVADKMSKLLSPIPSAIGPSITEASAKISAALLQQIVDIDPNDPITRKLGIQNMVADLKQAAYDAHLEVNKALGSDNGENRFSDSFAESLKQLTLRMEELDGAVSNLGSTSFTERVLTSFDKIRAKVREVVSVVTGPSPFVGGAAGPSGPPIQVQERELVLQQEQVRLSALQAQAKRDEELLGLQVQLGMKNELDAVRERYQIQLRLISGEETLLRVQLEQAQTAAQRLKIEAELAELVKQREFLGQIEPLQERGAELGGAGNFVDGLTASIKEFTKAASPFQLAQQGLTEGLNGFATAFTNATAAAINGTATIGEAFRNMAMSVLQQIQMIIIKMLVMAAIAAIFGVATGGVGTLFLAAAGMGAQAAGGGSGGGGGGGTSGDGAAEPQGRSGPSGGQIDAVLGRGVFSASSPRGGAGNGSGGGGGMMQPNVDVQVVNIRSDEDLNRWAESQQGRGKILKVTREDG